MPFPFPHAGGCTSTGSFDSAQVWPRVATLCLRSGAEVGRTPCLRGGCQEKLSHVQGQGQWPRVPGCDSAGAAKRSYPTSEVRDGSREKLSYIQCQGWQLRGVTPHPRSVGCVGGRRRAERSYSTFKVRRGGWEEIPLVKGKEQGLRSAGAAMKRYPTSKVRETQVRW